MSDQTAIADIAEVSGLGLRKVRYVLDQGLLPGGKQSSRGRGAARYFTDYEAFGIALAAWMLEAGLKRALVRDVMGVICLSSGGRSRALKLTNTPLYRCFTARVTAQVEIGDWAYARVCGTSLEGPFDTGWLPLDKDLTPSTGFKPLVAVVLDAGQIRRKLGKIGG